MRCDDAKDNLTTTIIHGQDYHEVSTYAVSTDTACCTESRIALLPTGA